MAKWSWLAIGVLTLSAIAACGSKSKVTPFLYTVGGTLSGLSAGGLVLTNVNGDTVSPPAGATTFTFPTSVGLGVAYDVTVTTQPTGQTCAVTANGQATVTANVTNVVVTCMDGTVMAVDSQSKPSVRAYASSWSDRNGNLWMFGGSQPPATSSNEAAALGDLWKFDVAEQNWTAVSTVGAHPGARSAAATAVAADGDLFLFGGVAMRGVVDDSPMLRDLWKFSPANATWTLLDAHATPVARGGAAAWRDATGDFWLFGGSADAANAGLLDDFWRYSVSTQRWTRIPGATHPSARRDARYWTDAQGHFWLFGGTTGSNAADELWEFNVATGSWALVNQADDAIRLRLSGLALAHSSSTSDCGKPGKPAAALTGATAWALSDGDVWLFGGSVGSAPCDTLWHWVQSSAGRVSTVGSAPDL